MIFVLWIHFTSCFYSFLSQSQWSASYHPNLTCWYHWIFWQKCQLPSCPKPFVILHTNILESRKNGNTITYNTCILYKVCGKNIFQTNTKLFNTKPYTREYFYYHLIWAIFLFLKSIFMLFIRVKRGRDRLSLTSSPIRWKETICIREKKRIKWGGVFKEQKS